MDTSLRATMKQRVLLPPTSKLDSFVIQAQSHSCQNGTLLTNIRRSQGPDSRTTMVRRSTLWTPADVQISG